MKSGFLHLLKTAFKDFKRNKVRTILTSLGIMIGVLSVVLLIALGIGLRNYLEEQFDNLGANLIMIFPGNVFSEDSGIGGGFGPGLAAGAEFDEKDVNNLRRISELDYVVPVFFKSLVIEAGTEKRTGYVQGTNEDVFEVMNLNMEAGNHFDKSDVIKKSKIVVLGYNMADGLFGSPESAINKTVKISGQKYRVTGVAEKMGDQEMDNSAIMPYRTTFGRLNPSKTFFSIYLGVKSDDDIEIVKEKAEEMLIKRYDEDDFSVAEQSEILSAVNSIFAIVNAILVAIGSISLLVGGIGIMNIMYASVTERTKEVGIRRAIGATKKDILTQFLVESIILSFLGGLAGLLLASLIVLAIRTIFPAAINLLAVTITFGVSSVIGIFFGVFPARRAANLSPISAIRYE